MRVRAEHALDADRFYDALLADHGTYVGPGHWFGQDRRAFRLGFAWPETDELERGLAGLSAAAAEQPLRQRAISAIPAKAATTPPPARG